MTHLARPEQVLILAEHEQAASLALAAWLSWTNRLAHAASECKARGLGSLDGGVKVATCGGRYLQVPMQNSLKQRHFSGERHRDEESRERECMIWI
mmetsp:Transcript_127124/g.329799  ORF Transcript_127124/g.329799 Transcript_127124/m.329799 type:complete len:96 (+) Transcript_127124:180-467(+)|eukprot:CAMPEP_0115315522 /NCGR_PEP_ID=MMETSP0270-20121206/77628_1 /TAXON_ID=71861 /ORGANISM="Scrippsiella trochoidea, Strain CCMP3099" /LENGTH=95 /DNA_ID=CAMNT_0002734855 /DNA_START=153 /DNA_END=440 /DNA_ORIENTATION=-